MLMDMPRLSTESNQNAERKSEKSSNYEKQPCLEDTIISWMHMSGRLVLDSFTNCYLRNSEMRVHSRVKVDKFAAAAESNSKDGLSCEEFIRTTGQVVV